MRREREKAESLYQKSLSKSQGEKQKTPNPFPKDPYNCTTCKAWAGGMLFKDRHCWKGGNTLEPVSLYNDGDKPGVEICIHRDDLWQALPQEDLIDKFQGIPRESILPSITVRGKRVCPVPLAWAPGLQEAIQWQTDLDAWRVPPFDGPSSAWPAGATNLLRHIRGVSGLLQMKTTNERQEASEVSADD